MAAELAAFLAGLGIRSTVVLAIVLVAVGVVRRFSSEERHLIVTAAMVGLLVLPAATLLLPGVQVRLDALSARLLGPPLDDGGEPLARPAPRGGAGTALDGTAGARTPAELDDAGRDMGLAGTDSREPGAGSSPGALMRAAGVGAAAAVGLYAGVAMLLLLRFALRAARVTRFARGLAEVTDERLLALALTVARRAGIERRRIRLCTSDADCTPWAWGLRHPVVVLPAGFESAPLAEQRNAMIHEVAHIGRMDWLWLHVSQVVCALYWFQPLAWLALTRIGNEAEHACDDRVLLAGATGPDYAEQLLSLAREIAARAAHGAAHRARAALAMAGSSPVSRRIKSILDRRTRRENVNTTKVAGAAAAILLLIAPVAALKSQPPEAAVAGGLDDPSFRALYNSGPANQEELERLVEVLLANGQAAEAESVIVGWVTGEYGAAGRECRVCVRALSGQRGLRAIAAPATELTAVVSNAFAAIEDIAQERRDATLLMWLAQACVDAHRGNAADRGLHYLLQANLLGDTGDRGRILTMRYMIEFGQYAEAKAIAQALLEDDSSEYHQSEAVRGWLAYIDVAEARVGQLAKIASGDDAIFEDGEYLPLVKEAPAYPAEAASVGKEGYVIVEYTITPDGRTQDARVVQSSDAVFEAAAVDSVASYRYAPRLTGGVPIDVPGVRTIIRFALEG
jgi:TonB family protein